MASFNRVVLVGNLTRDVELRRTPQGTAVTDIGLAVNERVKRNDEWVDEANFFDITLWGRTAEVASEYLAKGSSVLIEGRLKYETWSQEDGSKRSKVKVVGERMQMLGGRSGGGGQGNPSGSQASGSGSQVASNSPSYQQASSTPPPADDVPF
ncbi:single-stranded DNA-binding protein [Mariniblastus fucicola]|uniref:Single-stranded DNA-binding protein n=1 Tax=Mariniblastus fucicola TaxID=980251 RepID=A0A5B9P791_9BACT|nr:single-stranded DNA-binding protein [Mariniblastus fucicola]QEG22507.1 Single-stranded DNA-binding protein [Mariniblastus fucicola]